MKAVEEMSEKKSERELESANMESRLQQTQTEHATLLTSLCLLQSKLPASEGCKRSLFMAFKLLEAETKLRYVE